LLLEINRLEVPVGCEFLDTMVPQYICDLVSWGAIGARTTESQLHRELASGLSMPVGFKNGTSGDLQIAIDACKTSMFAHSFLGITEHGVPAICHSSGNEDVHVILRGGANGPNYQSEVVTDVVAKLRRANCNPSIIVDCSHGNSGKDYRKQKDVCRDVCVQLGNGEKNLVGVMIESNLIEGSQSVDLSIATANSEEPETRWQTDQKRTVLNSLIYGVSITDSCVGWEETVTLLHDLASGVRSRRLKFN